MKQQTRISICCMIIFSCLSLWGGYLIKTNLYSAKELVVAITFLLLAAIVSLTKVKFVIAKYLVFFILLVFAFSTLMISVVQSVSFENRFNKKLIFSVTNVNAQKTLHGQIPPNQTVKKCIWAGDNTEDFLEDVFVIVVTDKAGKVYYQEFKKGKDFHNKNIVLKD